MEKAPLVTDVERRKQVRLCLRNDLQITSQRYEGRTYFVIKDPVGLRYYRLDEKHCFLVQYLDGTHTLDEAQKEFEKRFRPDRLTLEELEAFGQQLLMAGLAHNDSPQAGKQLFERRRKRMRREWLQTLTNILYIKIPLFDPDKLLTRMLPALWWIFTTTFLMVSVGVMLAAIMLVATHFDTFREKLPSFRQFFSFRTLGFMWMALGLVKIIHEFGHGLSCKAFGGECHEMGALILCLSPALYCNVSDAWVMPSKWRRITISFAGIYVELIIASMATFLWWNTPSHPFLNNLCLSLMVVCSVSTVLFNGNPLMRYDGYYILCDWIEIPNLRDRANRFLKNLILEHCLGMEVRPEPYMALGRRILFVVFAVISWVYRWVITFVILRFLGMLLRPYKLEAVSSLLVMAAAGSMVGWPIYRMGEYLYKRGRLPDMKQRRVLVSAGVVAALMLAFFVLPLPISRVRQTALVELQPEAGVPLFVPEPAVLETLHVRDGQHVQENEALAVFRNHDLESDLANARTELNIRIMLIQSLQDRDADTNEANEHHKNQTEINKAMGERDYYAGLVDVYDQRHHALEIRAPRDGIVMGCPQVDDIGKQWEKDQGTPFCLVGDTHSLRVIMPVEPADYRLLKEDLAANPNLAVDILVQGRGLQSWKGRVGMLPESDAREIPQQLTSKAGGPLAEKPSANPNIHVPQSQQYLIPVNFQETDGTLCPGTLASVKIHCRWRSGAWYVWRFISGTFDLGLL